MTKSKNKSQAFLAKTKLVEKLSTELASASSVVLVDFKNMDVKTQQELKRKLREVDSRMVVVKNTLFKLAGETSKFPKEALSDSVLSGQTALVITKSDPIAPLQVLGKFAKELEVPQLKVGIIEGSFQDSDSLLKLSELPSKDILYQQVVGGVATPIYGLLSVLNADMQKFISVLQAKISEEKKEG